MFKGQRGEEQVRFTAADRDALNDLVLRTPEIAHGMKQIRLEQEMIRNEMKQEKELNSVKELLRYS